MERDEDGERGVQIVLALMRDGEGKYHINISDDSKEQNMLFAKIDPAPSLMDDKRKILRKNTLVNYGDSDLDFLPRKLPGLRRYTKDSDSSAIFTKSGSISFNSFFFASIFINSLYM